MSEKAAKEKAAREKLNQACMVQFTKAAKDSQTLLAAMDSRMYGKTSGYWGTPSGPTAAFQQAEAVQDQFNFGKGSYVVDPQIWEMEKQIDIGEQINNSIDAGGGMRPFFDQASKKIGVAVSFMWKNKIGNRKAHSFNSDPFDAIKTKAWPFGRVGGQIYNGEITVCENGYYFVKGQLVLVDDNYSWIADGDGFFHNRGINTLGNNWNESGLGNWRHVNAASAAFVGGIEPSLAAPTVSSVHPYPPGEAAETALEASAPLPARIFGDEVCWHQASSSYASGEMPIDYARDFHFTSFGRKN